MRIFSGRSGRKAAVSLIFATALIPLLMLVGLAIDFGFYNEAQAQLDMAADSAALHAVRVALQVYESSSKLKAATAISDSQTQGEAAGTAWFAAQEGNVPQAKFINLVSMLVTCSAAANQCEADVKYNGLIVTNFGKLFFPNYPGWGIAGAATAVISTLTYNEFDFLVDDSSSMLIASQPSDIVKLESLTPCSTQATAVATKTAQPLLGAYSWYYDPTGTKDNISNIPAPDNANVLEPYGYGTFTYKNSSGTNETINDAQLPLPPKKATGECDPQFYTGAVNGGYANECFYVPGQTTTATPPISLDPPLDPTTGLCTATASGKIGGTASQQFNAQKQLVTINGVPQAPCAFACHTDTSAVTNPAEYNDYFGLARANNVSLRFDDVQKALTGTDGVIPTLQKYVGNTGDLSPVTVGVYYFNTNFTTAVAAAPPTSANNSASLLSAAETTVQAITPPPVGDDADTDFPNAMSKMTEIYKNAGKVGNGDTPTEPKKNLFLVTDGMEDYNDGRGNRPQGPLDNNVLADCTTIKNLGVTIYVVYTTYYPLPNPYYLANDAKYAEPTANSPIYQALQSCASIGPDNEPLIAQAAGGTSITVALDKLLEKALNTPGRLSN